MTRANKTSINQQEEAVEEKFRETITLDSYPESGKIALFYGFQPVQSPEITKSILDQVKNMEDEWGAKEKLAMLELLSNPRTTGLTLPAMAYMCKPFPKSGEKGRGDKISCELCTVGSYRPVCESLLIQASRAILDSIGHKNTVVRINSIGNKESVVELDRKTNAFIRKHIAEMPSELRQHIKKDPYFILKSKDPKYAEIRSMAPQPLDFLGDESRSHFKDILEFLENMDIPYEVDHSLLGDPSYGSETVFSIVSADNTELARGMRWNRLYRKFHGKKDMGATSISINAKTKRAEKQVKHKQWKPELYLIQFGPEAKQKSFKALEVLRGSGLNVVHSMIKDKLSNQMISAEQAGTPYVILIGQKEALENVAMVRRIADRSQYTVPIEELGDFIKKNLK